MREQQIANLQPPGAGLPWWELMTLRCGFRYARMAICDEQAMRRFKLQADRIISLTAKLDRRQGTQRVLIPRITGIEDSSRFWSIFMVLDHLCIVNEQIILIVQTLMDAKDLRQAFRIEGVKPDPGVGPETMEAYADCVRRYESELAPRVPLKSRGRHVHPWFGPIDAHAWHCLAGIHHSIHRRQIVLILQRLTGRKG